jgi:hypothetical protein
VIPQTERHGISPEQLRVKRVGIAAHCKQYDMNWRLPFPRTVKCHLD